MLRLGALVVLGSLALLGACVGGARPFRCPEHGGAEWRELASDHFVLRTDLDAARAATLVGRFERMRAAVAAALPAARPAPGRVEVIAFRSAAEYAPFAPDGAEGYYLRSEGGPPRIVLSGEIRPDQRALLAHEIAHHFLAGAFVRQPRWFAEGVAVSMESLGADVPGGALVLGAPPEARVARARRSPVPARALLAWDGTAGNRDVLDWYAASWLLVHYLASDRAEAFADLQRRLAAGEAPEAAWRAAFPEYDPARPGAPEALDAALHAHARRHLEAVVREVAVPAAVGYFEQRIPSPEVHAIRLALWQHGPEKRLDALRAEVEETLAEDRAHPIALQYHAALWGEDPVRLARVAVEAHPLDPRAWTFLAHSLPGPTGAAEREDALRRASELAPENAAALHNLASELLAQGRSGEALPVARQAVRLAPWSPPILAGFAAVLSDLGQCAAAMPVQRRAIDALPERAPERARRAFEGTLGAYAQQCRVASGAPPQAPVP
ncbi:tetratricopeptide repeat protein [Anaeromyxobacter terrae]|uniref:hypothetical protein n=1 Tax=Anaeromyxobacter terrae TaxID=2925406 RepID=UPI001F563B4D|nr:hypothetical protein [Anaeromyxobacter sp. SG22]